MKMTCPRCGGDAELTVAAVVDEQFSSKAHDWKLTCACGMDAEGVFRWRHRVAVTLLFLIPVAVSWAVFLMYGEDITPDWLRFVIFMGHLIAGFLLGMGFSTRYGALVIRAMAINA